MGAKRTPGAAAGATPSDLEQRLAAEGLSPRSWGNDPGYCYGSHQHDYHKVLYCAAGSITFHTGDGDLELAAGDRLDVEPHTPHAATVGPQGVECVEAPAPG